MANVGTDTGLLTETVVRDVWLVSVHDLHGMVDGIVVKGKTVGGILGVRRVLSRIRTQGGPDRGVRVFLGGDVVAKQRHRLIRSTEQGRKAWSRVLEELRPYGATFGNHDLEFRGLSKIVAAAIHCHNVGGLAGGELCAQRGGGHHPNVCCKDVTLLSAMKERLAFVGVIEPDQRVTHDRPSAEIVEAAAAECLEHWRSKAFAGIRVLLAHVNGCVSNGYTPQEGFTVVLKAHDHQPTADMAFTERPVLPIVVEADINGRSVGLIKLTLNGDEVVAAETRRVPVAANVAEVRTKAWSTRAGLAAVSAADGGEEFAKVCDDGYIPFGGSADGVLWRPAMSYRRRACCIALRAMIETVRAEVRDRCIAVLSATAIRDDMLAPELGHEREPLTEWDIHRVYGSAFLRCFRIDDADCMADGLACMLGTGRSPTVDLRLRPGTYDDVPRLVIGYRDEYSMVPQRDDETVFAHRLEGADANGIGRGVALLEALPRSVAGPLYAIMPRHEAGVVMSPPTGGRPKGWTDVTDLEEALAGIGWDGQVPITLRRAICAAIRRDSRFPVLY